jgi:hypothetical protein
MFTSVAAVENELSKCISNYSDDRYSLLELLRFLGKHPYTRFSKAAIVLALKNQGVFVERGLKFLVENGIVAQEFENKIRLYSLTSNGNAHSWATELVKLDWCQWQSLIKQIPCFD